MDDRTKEIISEMSTTGGASETAIRDLGAKLRVRFPEEYVQFMLFTNGARGPIGEYSYLVVWPVEEVKAANDGYAIKEDNPELLLFGKDAAVTGYAFDTRDEHMPIVEVDLIDAELVTHVASNFQEFLEYLVNQSAD